MASTLIGMALERFRSTWESIVNPVVDSLSTWKPSTLTWIAMPLGVLGGLAVLMAPNTPYGANMLFGGMILITFAITLDALDGPLARRTGQVQDGVITLITPLTGCWMQCGSCVWQAPCLWVILPLVLQQHGSSYWAHTWALRHKQ